MANWNNPTLTSLYTDFLTELKARDTDLALQFDSGTLSNIPTGAIRWNSTVNRWQKWSGSAWGELTTTYALTGLSTTGNASIGGTLQVTGQTTLAGATATTPATDSNTTAVATTAYVVNRIAQDALLLTGGTITGNVTIRGAAGNVNGLEIGAGVTQNTLAFIDLTGDTTYTDFGLRITRKGDGPNTDSDIIHRGTGALRIFCQEFGSIKLITNSIDRAVIQSRGIWVGTSASTATPGVGNSTTGALIATGDGSNSSGFSASDYAPLSVNRNGNGTVVSIRRNGTEEGTISNTDGTVTYNSFLGAHWGRFQDDAKPDILPGTILDTADGMIHWRYVEINVEGELTRLAYSGPAAVGKTVKVKHEGKSYSAAVMEESSDELNKHVCVKVSDTMASSAVLGVFLRWDDEPAGGFATGWNDLQVGSIGNYVIRMAAGQQVKAGDLVISDGTGCGIVQADDVIRSCTVGKVTNAEPQRTYPDGSFLVPAVLYAG